MVTSVYVARTTTNHHIKEFLGKHDPVAITRMHNEGFDFLGYSERRLFDDEGMEQESDGGVANSPWVSLP